MRNTVLGLVCQTSGLPKAEQISYRTTTKTALDKLKPAEQAVKLLDIYRANVRTLRRAIVYCQAQQIGMFRMSSSMFPFADDDCFSDLLTDVATDLRSIGTLAQTAGIRLLSHPDQFCVLSSDKPQVIQNSIRILAHEARVFDLMGLPRSQWAAMNVHVGRKGPDALRAIVKTIARLPDNIASRLTLENDEHKQDSASTIAVCRETGVACLFDWHHELVSSKAASYDDPALYDLAAQARDTWTCRDWAVNHLSNGAAGLHDPKHSGLIALRPTDLSQIGWLEIEAKGKEMAIAQFPWQFVRTP